MTRFLTADEAAAAIRRLHRNDPKPLTASNIPLNFIDERERQAYCKALRDRRDALLAELKAKREAQMIYTDLAPDPLPPAAPAPAANTNAATVGTAENQEPKQSAAPELNAIPALDLKWKKHDHRPVYIKVDGKGRNLSTIEPLKPWRPATFEAGKMYIVLYRYRGVLYYKSFICKERTTKCGREFVTLLPDNSRLQSHQCSFSAEISSLDGSEYALCFSHNRIPWRLLAMLTSDMAAAYGAVPSPHKSDF